MQHISRLTTAILSTLLVMLGFGSCRSTKKTIQKAEEAALAEEAARTDSIRRARQNAMPIVRPDDSSQKRVLYGPPPSRFRQDL